MGGEYTSWFLNQLPEVVLEKRMMVEKLSWFFHAGLIFSAPLPTWEHTNPRAWR